jgi:hypothetical protein
MVGNPINDMDIPKVLKPFARKIFALKTPGYSVTRRTSPEPMPAVRTMPGYPVRKTSVAADRIFGKPLILG